jgi:hypothetical protein
MCYAYAGYGSNGTKRKEHGTNWNYHMMARTRIFSLHRRYRRQQNGQILDFIMGARKGAQEFCANIIKKSQEEECYGAKDST